MMSNDQNLISDFAAYFTSLGTAIFKERDSMAVSVFYKQPFGDNRENSSPSNSQRER